MNNPQEVKDPDDLSAEELQEIADIKREELEENTPLQVEDSTTQVENAAVDTDKVDPNAFDVIGGGETKEIPEVVGDISSLSLNEKYALILHQAKQLGPLFFAQVSPDTFKLPERDPLNLIWINILTGWHIASDILAKFEANMVAAEQLERESADVDGNETNQSTKESSTESE